MAMEISFIDLWVWQWMELKHIIKIIEKIIDYIEYHKEELKDFFTDDEESNPHWSLKIKIKIQKLNEYIENAKQDGCHAWFMEIKAAASLLNMRIVIYRLNLSFMYELMISIMKFIKQKIILVCIM